MCGIVGLLIKQPSLRERLFAVDPGGEEAEATPVVADGVELDGAVLGTATATGTLSRTNGSTT